MDSNNNCKLQIPRDEKHSLGLIQPFLVMQLYIPNGKSFTFEINLTDGTRTRRRLIFTTGTKEISTSTLHTKIPLNSLTRNTWLNFSIDIASFCTSLFKGSVFRTLDSFNICSHCRLRRVFAMRTPLLDVNDESHDLAGNAPLDILPKSVEFPVGVNFSNQVYSFDKIGQDTSNDDIPKIEPTQMFVEGTKVPKTVQIAFGTRFMKPNGNKAEDKKQHASQISMDENYHNKSTIAESSQDVFKTQHPIIGTVNIKNEKLDASKKTKKPAIFNPRKIPRKGREQPKIAVDSKITYNTLAFQPPEESKATPLNFNFDRDASEQPRQSPLYKNSHKQRSKESPLRSNNKSPMNGLMSKDGKLMPPGNFDPHNKNIIRNGGSKGSKGRKPANLNGGWVGNEDKEAQPILNLMNQRKQVMPNTNYGNLSNNNNNKAMKNSGSTSVVAIEERNASENRTKKTPKKPIWSAKRKDPAGLPPRKVNGKKLFSDNTEKSTARPEDKTGTLLEESLGGLQLNSFTIPVRENNKEIVKDQEEIEEIIEIDEKASEKHSHKDTDSIKDSLGDPSPLLLSVNEKSPMQKQKENAGKIAKTQTSHWIKSDIEENKNIGNEEEKVELVGGKNPSLADAINRPFNVLQEKDNLRPFSPPFAQLKGGNNTNSPNLKLSPMKMSNKYEDSLDNKIIEFHNEDDEKINVIYDPVLKCYYDPKTNEYYQLNK